MNGLIVVMIICVSSILVVVSIAALGKFRWNWFESDTRVKARMEFDIERLKMAIECAPTQPVRERFAQQLCFYERNYDEHLIKMHRKFWGIKFKEFGW